MFYDTLNQLLFAPTLFHDLHINWFAARNFRVSEVDYLRSINNQTFDDCMERGKKNTFL